MVAYIAASKKCCLVLRVCLLSLSNRSENSLGSEKIVCSCGLNVSDPKMIKPVYKGSQRKAFQNGRVDVFIIDVNSWKLLLISVAQLCGKTMIRKIKPAFLSPFHEPAVILLSIFLLSSLLTSNGQSKKIRLITSVIVQSLLSPSFFYNYSQ